MPQFFLKHYEKKSTKNFRPTDIFSHSEPNFFLVKIESWNFVSLISMLKIDFEYENAHVVSSLTHRKKILNRV